MAKAWPTEWYPFDREAGSFPELQDHFYYLVTDTRFETPMKAKWHSDAGGRWDILGVPNGLRNCFYTFDEDCPIIAWCELPPVPFVPPVEEDDRK